MSASEKLASPVLPAIAIDWPGPMPPPLLPPLALAVLLPISNIPFVVVVRVHLLHRLDVQ